MLSEVMRDTIYKRVMEEGNALKAVSEEFGVDVRRVAAVVRLKEVEKQWVRDVSFSPFLCSGHFPLPILLVLFVNYERMI